MFWNNVQYSPFANAINNTHFWEFPRSQVFNTFFFTSAWEWRSRPGCLNNFTCFLFFLAPQFCCSGGPRTDRCTLGGVSQEQRVRIISLDLLAIVQARIWLAFWDARSHYWLTFNFSITNIPSSFVSSFHSFIPQPKLIFEIAPCQDAALFTWLCWTSWGSHGPRFVKSNWKYEFDK